MLCQGLDLRVVASGGRYFFHSFYTTSYWSQLVPKLVLSGATFCSSKTVWFFFLILMLFLREILIFLRNKNYSWPKHDECRMNVIPLPGIKRLEGSGLPPPPCQPPIPFLYPLLYNTSSKQKIKNLNGIIHGNSLFSYTLQYSESYQIEKIDIWAQWINFLAFMAFLALWLKLTSLYGLYSGEKFFIGFLAELGNFKHFEPHLFFGKFWPFLALRPLWPSKAKKIFFGLWRPQRLQGQKRPKFSKK